MTIVVGYEGEGGVHMAADWLVTTNATSHPMVESKISSQGGFLIGCAGSLRAMDIIQNGIDWEDFSIDSIIEEKGVDIALKSHVVFSIQKALKQYDAWDNQSRSYQGQMLIASRGELYRIGSHLGVSRSARKYNAIGIGNECAMGAMYKGDPINPRGIVVDAVLAASELVEGCGCAEKSPAYFWQTKEG